VSFFFLLYEKIDKNMVGYTDASMDFPSRIYDEEDIKRIIDKSCFFLSMIIVQTTFLFLIGCILLKKFIFVILLAI
jgi:hypothetical protein